MWGDQGSLTAPFFVWPLRNPFADKNQVEGQ
jgi:hypothetical protein